jgi:hypothetical protein
MIRELEYEAAYLRAALLVGLVHEADVPGWALDAIQVTTEPAVTSLLAEIVSVPVELSAMREALYPLAKAVAPHRVGDALLMALAIDNVTTERSMADRLHILEQIRHEGRLNKDRAWVIKDFSMRALLASGGVPEAVIPGLAEVTRWLDVASGEGYFLFSFDREADASAFLATLSEHIDSHPAPSEQSGRPPRMWTLPANASRSIAVVNERALMVLIRARHPVALASRIPYTTLPLEAREVQTKP